MAKKFDIKIKRIDGTKKRYKVIFEGCVVGEISRKAENFWKDSYGGNHTNYGDAAGVEIRVAILGNDIERID